MTQSERVFNVPQVLKLFPRQTLLAQGALTQYFSEIFDVSQFVAISGELRVYAITAGTVLCRIQQCSQPELGPDAVWSNFVVTIGAAAGIALPIAGTNPARFVRANAEISNAGAVATFAVELIARESS